MKKTITAAVLAATVAASGLVQSAEYSAGLGIGAGVGVTVSKKNSHHFRDDDQLQTRLEIFNASFDDAEEIDLSGIEYEGDVGFNAIKASMDWYPFSGKARKVFFSGGLAYSSAEIDAEANLKKSFKVGDTQVNPGDIQGLQLDIDQDPVSPYLGVGWGNRIGEDSGFSFLIELGVAMPLSDADVSLKAEDTAGIISAANLEKERKQLEDDLDGLSAIGTIGITYHF